MNPLEMVIEIGEEEHGHGTGFIIKCPPLITKYGVFTPPEGSHRDFDPYKTTLFTLSYFDGRKLSDLFDEVNDPSSYLYESRPRNLIEDLNQLHVMGAIDVKGDRIVLRTRVPNPLELLARSATD